MQKYISPECLKESLDQLIITCHLAWQEGLMRGWSGNASILADKDQDLILITAAGSSKGNLSAKEFLLITKQGEIIAGEGRPSSESRMHLAIYAKCEKCNAILHTHPPYLQALSLYAANLNQPKKFIDLPLYEAAMWKKHLAMASNGNPGSSELAEAVNIAIDQLQSIPAPKAIWLPYHGLCCMGDCMKDALYLTEELEHLAKVQMSYLTLNTNN